MPKLPKAFVRRKSAANAMEMATEAPTESSFKVFERADGGSKSFDGGIKLAQSATALGGRPRISQRDSNEENMFADVKVNRGSSTSNTNTASTADDSSRLSAASTAPSSADLSGQDDTKALNALRKDIPIPPVPKSTSTFSLRNAGRAMSWTRSKGPALSPPRTAETTPAPSSPAPDESQGRSRAVTASSYASTATPPKLDEKDLGLSLGGDFGDMFSSFENRRSAILTDTRAMSRSPETLPSGPTGRPQSSGRLNPPPPLTIDNNDKVEAAPYSWSSHHSNEGLMSNSSPITPREDQPPAVPPHAHSVLNSTNSFARTPRPGNTGQNGLKRSSAIAARRQSTLDFADGTDEDARLLRESINASRRLERPNYSPGVRDSWASPVLLDSPSRGSKDQPEARVAQALAPKPSSDSLFDTQITESADLALRFQEQASAPSPPVPRHAPHNKVMTPAQFERYRQEQATLRVLGGQQKDEEEDGEEIYEEEEDEAEKNKRIAKQRRKQEAHMAVYRQQMMKVTGESSPVAPLSRPSMLATQSTPNLTDTDVGDDGEDDDEDVPLGILAAHGFPSKSRPPTGRLSSMSSNPNLRAAAQSVAAGPSGRLPAFAKNLPQDPYMGAGLVYPTNRESMAFSGGAGSVQGAPSRSLPAGGLVGVIATEERSRAMRRGSPNAQGEYPTGPPANAFNGMGMPQMLPQQPMMLTPGDQAQIQMSQQMSQFMQMQMQFMQMMTVNQNPMQQPMPMPPPSVNEMPRPSSQHLRPDSHLRPGSSQQRSMTMMDLTASGWPQGGSMFAPSTFGQNPGYTPSMAPTERSNVGMPGRYRPVSQMPPPDRGSRTSTLMSGGLQNWETKNGPTVKTVKKSGHASDEDDEEGWEEMAKKRAQKKSAWRSKRATNNGLKDMLAFAEA